MHKNQSETTIDKSIITVIKKNNPKTIEELIKLVQQEHPLPEQKIIERILHLQDQGKIALKEHPAPSPPQLKNYIFSTKANWYWTIIAVAAITVALVFTVPENAYPIVYARYAFGSFFVLFLPGFALVKALFPTKELENTERIGLSIGMSIALVPLIGLLLNYTPWGLRITPVTLSLLTLTTTLATIGILREQETLRKEKTSK